MGRFVLGSFASIATLLLLAAPARADETGSARADDALLARSFEIGARTGAGFPFGKVAGGYQPITAVSVAQAPVWIDFAMRFHHLALGAYGSAGFISSKNCDSCNGVDFRTGVEAAWHFYPRSSGPWVGAGVGVERFIDPDPSDSFSWNGLEGNVQGGFDFLATRGLKLGAFATLSLSEMYGAQTAGGPYSYTPALHGWFFAGIRGLVDLGG